MVKHIVSNDEFFGINAGKVWESLKSNGPMSITRLCGNLDMEDNEVFGALGWLGREGRINIEKSRKSYVCSLTE